MKYISPVLIILLLACLIRFDIHIRQQSQEIQQQQTTIQTQQQDIQTLQQRLDTVEQRMDQVAAFNAVVGGKMQTEWEESHK